jgi:AcrR family transcriptional regulator
MPRAAKRPRGRPPRLSRVQIVEEALRLIDDRGADALTMRALAADLGVDPMAVYRHVRDKEDLLGAMCDAVIARLPPFVPDRPWREQVGQLAGGLYDLLVTRPALLPVLAAAPMTPASVEVAERAVALLEAQGVKRRVATAGFDAVFAYVLGFALVEVSLQDPGDFAFGLDLLLDGIERRATD